MATNAEYGSIALHAHIPHRQQISPNAFDGLDVLHTPIWRLIATVSITYPACPQWHEVRQWPCLSY